MLVNMYVLSFILKNIYDNFKFYTWNTNKEKFLLIVLRTIITFMVHFLEFENILRFLDISKFMKVE